MANSSLFIILLTFVVVVMNHKYNTMHSHNNEEEFDCCVDRGLGLFKKIEEGLCSSNSYIEFLNLLHHYVSGEMELEPVLAYVHPGLIDEFHDFAEYCGIKIKKKLWDECEDLKYELEMLVEALRSTKELAERLLNEIQANDSLEDPIQIQDYFTTRHIMCIEKLYDNKGCEVVHILCESPRVALPVLVPRLHQKLEEFKETARLFTFDCYFEKKF